MPRWVCAALLLVFLVGCSSSAGRPSETADTPNTANVVFNLGNSPEEACPNREELVTTGPSDEAILRSLVPQMAAEMYNQEGYEEYTISRVAMAAQSGVHGEMITTWCGPEVANSSWVVGLTFPRMAPSASMSGGIFMLSKTKAGWEVWYRYR